MSQGLLQHTRSVRDSTSEDQLCTLGFCYLYLFQSFLTSCVSQAGKLQIKPPSTTPRLKLFCSFSSLVLSVFS